MKKTKYLFMLMIILFVLPACSSGNKSDETAMLAPESFQSSDMIATTEEMNQEEAGTNKVSSDARIPQDDRMVVYTADIQMRVKDFSVAEAKIIAHAEKLGGYMVSSEVYRHTDEQMSGSLTVRVPTGKFDDFLTDVAESGLEVTNRSISGQNVTEQYIDLETRLASKRIVEARLLQFMDEAKKTEDLLKISADLAKVQEEIEQIVGQVTYLKNQVNYSTVSIHLYEDNVVVPNFNKENQNILERIKKQLVVSTNVLVATVTAAIVFAVGNIPVIAVAAIVVVAGVYLGKQIVKRREKKKVLEEKERVDE